MSTSFVTKIRTRLGKWLIVIVAALLLATGFAAGTYFGVRKALIDRVRRDSRLFGPGHDEFIFLGKYGSKEDLPFLFYGLKHQTNTNVCTYAHCVEALQKLTGANPGSSYSDWTNWWVNETKQPVADWHPVYKNVKWERW